MADAVKTPAASTGEAATPKISKQEAVRQALAKFGHDARPVQIQTWSQKKFRIQMSTGSILRKLGSQGNGGGKATASAPPAAPRAEAKAAAPKAEPSRKAEPSAGGGRESGIPLKDILYIKELVGRFGPEQLHTLIEAFVR